MILFLTITAQAENYHAMVMDANNRASSQIALYRKEAERIQNSLFTRIHDESLSNMQSSSMNDKKMNPNILIFVSFSILKESLVAYLRDAKKIGASVVIRGLIENSFQKTFMHIATLVKAAEGGGVELNPFWFKRFSIQAVPAVVVVPKNSICIVKDYCDREKDYDVMTGNITLASALSMIHNNSQLTKVITQAALMKLQDQSDA